MPCCALTLSSVPADPKPPLSCRNWRKAWRRLHRHMTRLSSGTSSIRYFLFWRMKVMPLSTLSSNSPSRCSRADSGISFGSLCSHVFTYGRQPRSTGSCEHSGQQSGRQEAIRNVHGTWLEVGRTLYSPQIIIVDILT